MWSELSFKAEIATNSEPFMLRIYNSLSKQKEEFKPLIPGKIGLYVCGMTVYDYCHLGHGRLLVAFDGIVRYLRWRGYEVTYVRNITDIDDKIINRANERQEPIDALTATFIEAMHDDERALAVLPPDHEPRATQHIDTMLAMIKTLIDKGFAYVAANGDVYYDVSRFVTYGQLAQKDLAGQEAGARIGVVDVKRNPLDFVLWKLAKPGEPHWSSPWGEGRPGWHIECSAMSTHCLGNHFDIHGGGFDLQFPHHENEIAQSEAATGEKFSNTWMHIGFLQINREKMSKSLGNFFTVREVLKEYAPEVVRYFLISSHYRSQLNYSTDNLQTAHAALVRFYQCLRDLPVAVAPTQSEFIDRFQAAMDDDFNTPQALAVLFDLARQINTLRDSDVTQAAQLGALLKSLGNIFGILQQTPEDFLQQGLSPELRSKIEALIAERLTARAQKNWARSDEIRNELQQLGVAIEDGPEGTVWRLLT
jgi:cysteinyl-tRNA synthetase